MNEIMKAVKRYDRIRNSNEDALTKIVATINAADELAGLVREWLSKEGTQRRWKEYSKSERGKKAMEWTHGQTVRTVFIDGAKWESATKE